VQFYFRLLRYAHAQPYNYRFDLLNETTGFRVEEQVCYTGLPRYIVDCDRRWIKPLLWLSFKVYKNIPGQFFAYFNHVFRMIEDEDHKIWVRYLYYDGLSCFDPITEKFTTLSR